jgi:sugar phosphate isomerase/epimerase
MNIESFRGDFDQVASLIQQAWAENDKQPLLYTSEFLRSLFEYPNADFSLAPTLYDGTKPIAFIAGFPRCLRVRNRKLRIVIGSFLSVSREFKKRGYGIVLWSDLVKRVRAAGYDGMMNYCVEGEPMNGMILGCCSRLKMPVEHAFSIHYLSRLLWPKGPGSVERNPDDRIVDAFMELAAPIANRAPLSRLWSRPEAEWQCSRRLGAIAVQERVGRRLGILTGYMMQVADPKHTRCFLIEDIFWGDLEREERLQLVRRLESEAAAAGARLAVVPVLGYGDMEPLLSEGFRPSGRTVHAYFSNWSDHIALGRLDAMYLDVF